MVLRATHPVTDAISPADAAKELLARRKARDSLAAYATYFLPEPPVKHHLMLIEQLERVERGEISNLIVCMPPGSAKSSYTSIVLPAWYLSRNPDKQVIAASHTVDLVEGFGRRARNLIADPAHRNLFDKIIVAPDSSAAGRWSTNKGGGYYAVGVGGSVTGRRADLIIVDDPVRGREDADSERVRKKTWDWYLNDLVTRGKPGCKTIIVATRWHEDDLIGRILARDGDKWTVVSLPMIAMPDDPLGRQEGERLWPEWFTDDMVATAQQDRRSWMALYQQQPSPDDGDFFRAEWFQTYRFPPTNLHIYGASDYAVTAGSGDYTEHGIFGVDVSGNIYVLDWWRGQKTADVWIDHKCDLIHKYKPLCWFGEAGPIRRAIEPFMLSRMSERRAYCRIEWLPSTIDKATRARSIQARASMGKLFWPENAPWKSDVMDQLLKFPAGKYDDAVDVFSLLGRGLAHVSAPRVNDEDDFYEDRDQRGRSDTGGY